LNCRENANTPDAVFSFFVIIFVNSSKTFTFAFISDGSFITCIYVCNYHKYSNLNVASCYRGLSHAKSGNNDHAKKIFESLISEAGKQMQTADAEAGAIFGRREAEAAGMSRLYTMRCPGYKGMGELQKAKEDLDTL
jgi:hypothetical protein